MKSSFVRMQCKRGFFLSCVSLLEVEHEGAEGLHLVERHGIVQRRPNAPDRAATTSQSAESDPNSVARETHR